MTSLELLSVLGLTLVIWAYAYRASARKLNSKPEVERRGSVVIWRDDQLWMEYYPSIMDDHLDTLICSNCLTQKSLN